MIIRAVKLRASTSEGQCGFEFRFGRVLTIIRAKNSSGKSTLFNCLLYGLGMEELAGGRNEKALPYAVKEHFEYEGRRIIVTASEVLLEIESRSGRVVTLRRAIRDEVRDAKLIEVFDGAHLTGGHPLGIARPTFLHDSGGARRTEGFHRFLEDFLGLALPRVPATNGGEVQLYLQAIFAALGVEQKRGWTDYIANIPFFGIREARTKVVEYLLGLGVFEANTTRNRLNAERDSLEVEWRHIYETLKREAKTLGVVLEGVPSAPSPLFSESSASLRKLRGDSSVALPEHISRLRAEHTDLKQQAERYQKTSGAEAVNGVATAMAELQELSILYERATNLHSEQRMALGEYSKLLAEVNEDLEKNRVVVKLRDLGAQQHLASAAGRCPTCNQPVEDTLLAGAVTGPQMDLAANISYLESQRRMLMRQIAGLEDSLAASGVRVADFAAVIASKRDLLVALRGDVTSGASESKAILRRQLQIEVEVQDLDMLQERSVGYLAQLRGIAARASANDVSRRGMPKETYSAADIQRIDRFQLNFRENARLFGYASAPVGEIEIGRGTLVPSLAHLELREIRTDIKSDSSASDFVRLIWSYLLALYQTSANAAHSGHHPGLLMFDEPGQHSMAVSSQHALLKQLANEPNLQSIVAASFDESEEVFQQATAGIEFTLIEWEGKLLRPL